VSHQLHEGREPNSTVEQFRGPGVPQAVRRDGFGVCAAGSFGSIRQRQTQSLKQRKATTHSKQEEIFGFRQTSRRSHSTQFLNPL